MLDKIDLYKYGQTKNSLVFYSVDKESRQINMVTNESGQELFYTKANVNKLAIAESFGGGERGLIVEYSDVYILSRSLED